MKTRFLKVLFTFLLLTIFFAELNAQSVHWAEKGISEGFDNGNGIVSDDSGNVYITGQIEFSAVFGSYTLNSYGIHDILVAKYNSEGTIKWIHNAGGTGGDVGNAIGIDGSHNTYVAGEVETTASFGSGVSLTSSGSNDIFLAKYGIGGQITWAKRFGSSSSDKALAIAVSPSGDCFITGYFSSTVNFSGTNLSSSGNNDVFVLKTNSSGTVQWVKKAGGSREDRGNGIALDRSGNIYVTGTFTQSASFSGTSISNTGKNSSFLAKYNSNGQVQWVRSSGACCDTTQSNAVTVDENGNIYITGYFQDQTKFGNTQFSSSGNYDVFVVKYDPSGNVVWTKKAGGIEEDKAYGITADTINNLIYVTGSVWGTGNFGSNTYSAAGFKDIFVAAYDYSGNEQWVKTQGGGYRDVGSAIAVDPLGYIYTTGIFNDDALFDGITLTGYPNQPWADFYVDKISAEPVSSPANAATNLAITPTNCSDLRLTFTPGSGSKRIVVVHKSSAVNAIPVDGFVYTANIQYGNGSNLGSNNYVVYNGTGSSVTVSGLTAGTTYYFSVIEYDGIGATINYKNGTTLDGYAVAGTVSINISGLQNAICEDETLYLQASGASSYTWSPSSGLSTTTGSFVTAQPQSTTTYTVTAVNSSGCQGITNFTITVHANPSTSFPNLSDVCLNDLPFMLTTGIPQGGIYSGTGVNNGQFNPSLAGVGSYVLLYEYTNANGCSDENQATITVKPNPTVSIGSMSIMCENEPPVVLNSGIPAGGDYSGTGVIAGVFYPSLAQGVQLVTYAYLDTNGCSASASTNAIVLSSPQFDLGNDTILCAWSSILLDAGIGFDTYLWSNGSTGSSVIVDSNGTGIGINNITVTVSNISGCVKRDTVRISFDLCAGIDDANDNLNGIHIFPNPFNANFSISTDKSISYIIYDVCGKIIEKNNPVNGPFSAGENLSPGFYYLEIKSGNVKKLFPLTKYQ